MSDEREFYYLQEQDAAAADWDIDPTPPAYPEWNRRRVEAGQPVGTLKVSFDGKPYGDYPVVAVEAVPVAGIFGRMIDTVRLWFN